MPGTKIACLGAGSLYFPRALPDLALAEELAGSEIVLYDIDQEKSELMAQMGRRLVATAGASMTVRPTQRLEDALEDCTFALASIGGSGAEVTENVYASRYHYYDVAIPAKYGIQQVIGDTAGPAGMMMGLRVVPVYLSICREMEKRCPNAILLNHANPMAVVCRAVRKYTSINTIGICHGVQEGMAQIAALLGVDVHTLECRWIGTNHYHWFTQIRCNGQDVYPEVMERLRNKLNANEGLDFSTRLSLAYGHCITYGEDSHLFEFYPFAAQARRQRDLPYRLDEMARRFGYDEAQPKAYERQPTAAERSAFLEHYRGILDEVVLPGKRDDSITGEGIGALMSAIVTGKREVFIVNVDNRSAIPNLPFTAQVEVEAVTDSLGVRPVYAGNAPLVLKGILEKRFVWQELVADAAATGNRALALQALLVDEMAIVPEKAEAMLDELLASSAELLPLFTESC